MNLKKNKETVYDIIHTSNEKLDSVDIASKSKLRADYVMEAISALKKEGRIKRISSGIIGWYKSL